MRYLLRAWLTRDGYAVKWDPDVPLPRLLAASLSLMLVAAPLAEMKLVFTVSPSERLRIALKNGDSNPPRQLLTGISPDKE